MADTDGTRPPSEQDHEPNKRARADDSTGSSSRCLADTEHGLIQEQGRRPEGRDGIGPTSEIAVGNASVPRLEGRELRTALHGSRGGAGSTWTN